MWDNNVPWVWEAPTPTKEETLTLPTTHCSDPMYKPMYSCKYKYTNRQFFKRFYQRNCPPPIALIPPTNRVAEVARGHRGPPSKSLDSDENFKPQHTLFCRELRFVSIYTPFGDRWAKKVLFWVKNNVSWARSALLHGTNCIFN